MKCVALTLMKVQSMSSLITLAKKQGLIFPSNVHTTEKKHRSINSSVAQVFNSRCYSYFFPCSKHILQIINNNVFAHKKSQ